MPYVDADYRKTWKSRLRRLLCTVTAEDISAGELNYIITKLLLATYPSTYAEFNRLVGVLECCKLEFYRRAVAAYEDEKIQENGDVYDSKGTS